MEEPGKGDEAHGELGRAMGRAERATKGWGRIGRVVEVRKSCREPGTVVKGQGGIERTRKGSRG